MNPKSDFGYYPYPTLNYEYDVGRERERNAMAFKKMGWHKSLIL